MARSSKGISIAGALVFARFAGIPTSRKRVAGIDLAIVCHPRPCEKQLRCTWLKSQLHIFRK
jgi:hypothetical protein